MSGTASNVDSTTGIPLQGLPVVANEYNSHGYLEQLRNATDDTILWKALETDNFGNVITSESGDGRFTSSKLFNPETGLVVSHSVQRGSNLPLQQLSYQWDTLGNLRLRRDENSNTDEIFGYDELNRLTDATIGSTVQSYQYDDFGNITKKDGKDYLYQESGNAGPHAVTSVGGVGYIYDANGNQTSGNGRALTYAAFGKPIEITKGTTKVKFDYNPSRNRYKKLSYINTNTLDETKISAGGVEVIYKGNTTEVRSYITDALMKFTYTGSSITPTKSISYLFKDHLGSTDTVVTPNGNLDDVVKMSFGSFGERRNIDWDGFLPLASTTPLLAITDKGYTGHEQLDDVGLIHMNGRVYDPAIGRFMSADPNIQAPTNTQSLNRYSYVINNPLSATDPSGYFFGKLLSGIVKSQVFSAIISIGLNAIPGVGVFLSTVWTAYSQAQAYFGYVSLARTFASGNGRAIAASAFSSFAGAWFSGEVAKCKCFTTEVTSSQESTSNSQNTAAEHGGVPGGNSSGSSTSDNSSSGSSSSVGNSSGGNSSGGNSSGGGSSSGSSANNNEGGNLATATSTFDKQGGLGESISRVETYEGGAIIWGKRPKNKNTKSLILRKVGVIKKYLNEHFRVGWAVSVNFSKVFGATIDLGSGNLSDKTGSKMTVHGEIATFSEGRTLTSVSLFGLFEISAENVTSDNGLSWIYGEPQINEGFLIKWYKGERIEMDVSIGIGLIYEETFIFNEK